MEKKKKITPIAIKGYSVRKKPFFGNRNTKHVNFSPTEKSITEDQLSEAPVTVKAKSSKTSRVIVKRFKSREDAAKHYIKWLKKGNKREVSLESKSLASDIPLEILQEVYNRGLSDWSAEKPFSQDQWAFSRVNSFIQGGSALDMDSDLISEVRIYKITAKTSNKSLGKLSKRKDTVGRQARSELRKRLAKAKVGSFDNKKIASKKLQSVLSGKSSLSPAIAKKLIKTLEINPKSHVAKSLNKVAKDTKAKKVIGSKIKKAVTKKTNSLQDRYNKLDIRHREFVDMVSKDESDKIRARAREYRAQKARGDPRPAVNIAPEYKKEEPKKPSFLSRIGGFLKKKRSQIADTSKQPELSDAQFQELLKRFKPDV